MGKVGIRIVATYRCDLRCPYCYQKEFKGTRLTLERLSVALDTIPIGGIQRVTLQGGEISLIPGAEKYVDLVAEKLKGARISVTSNGSGPVDFYAAILARGAKLAISDHNRMAIPCSKTGDLVPSEILQTILSATDGDSRARIRINAYWDGDEQKAAKLIRMCDSLGLKLTFCFELTENAKPNAAAFLGNIARFSPEASLYEVKSRGWRTDFEKNGKSVFSLFARDAQLDKTEWIVLPNGSVSENLEDMWIGAGAGSGAKAKKPGGTMARIIAMPYPNK